MSDAHQLVCVALVVDELSRIVRLYDTESLGAICTHICRNEYQVCTGHAPTGQTALYDQLRRAIRFVQAMRYDRPPASAVSRANQMYEFCDIPSTNQADQSGDANADDALRLARIHCALTKMYDIARSHALNTQQALGGFRETRLTKSECDAVMYRAVLPPKKKMQQVSRLVMDARCDMKHIMTRGQFV